MIPPFAKNVLYYGQAEPSPERVLLRAGPFTLFYEAGDLRYIKLGQREVLRRIYSALRDRHWGTVPAQLSNARIEIGADSFRLAYDVENKQGEINFFWRGEISGNTSGQITFTMDGEARSTFLRNRLGFCVLHPIRECAGGICRVERADGTKEQLVFPRLVAAEQPLRGLHDITTLAHEIEPGLWAEVRFTGELFEVEDQRNWIDASFKTFCTPLRLPFPVEVKAGTRITQSVTLRLIEEGEPERTGRDAFHRVPFLLDRIGDGVESVPTVRRQDAETRFVSVTIEQGGPPRPLPPIGLSMASHDLPFQERQVQRLAALNIAHLRVDVPMSDPQWRDRLRRASKEASDVGAKLEIAVELSKSASSELKALAEFCEQQRPEVLRWLILDAGAETTTEHVLKLARKHLAPCDAPMGGGTNADFYQLNQFRPPAGLCDFIFWSMNPQVHAFDNTSLAETPEAIGSQIRSAREYFPGQPLLVSPVTLKPRFNPVATGPESTPKLDELPPPVDVRQMSLVGAGWLLASLKHLAEAGLTSVTFFETTGWRGVMETAAASPLPERFRSIPGAVFPLYHVLADVGEFAGGEVMLSQSPHPLVVEVLALRRAARTRVLLANLSGQPQRVRVPWFGAEARVRCLDETNAMAAMTTPEQFRAQPGEVKQAPAQMLDVELLPYAVAKIDGQS